MTSVRGIISAGEAQATIGSIGKRMRGSIIPYYLLMTGMVFGGAVLGYLVGSALDVRADFTMFAGIVAGAVGYTFVCRKWTVSRFRRNMDQRGLTLNLSVLLEVTPQSLICVSDGVSREAPWSAVTDLFLDKGYWIFMVQMEPWFAPRHFFEDAASEKAFLQAALAQMTPDAQARSEDVRHFLSQA